METREKSRRAFIKKSALAGAAITLGAKSYGQIIGANDRINIGIVGVNGRGQQLLKSAASNENTVIKYICDADTRALENAIMMAKEFSHKPKGIEDFRKLIEKKDLDAIAVATPEHWHAPMAIMGAKAGKHVYLEKPSAHNPAEGYKLVETQKETGMVIQVGTQQRSAPTTMQGLQEIREGVIGKPYYAKTWYSNTRGTIGSGKEVPVPEWLNWDLWQGPAPRRNYKDNVVHYNWHWFWHWGTGEIHNNGTHEIDIARLALGVGYPDQVSLSGGRYHFDDDWEFYDTQMLNFQYDDGKSITWEGKSCNGLKFYDRGRGITIHGTEGSALLDRNIYILYDLSGNEIKRIQEEAQSATTDTIGAGALDVYHMKNFLNAIRKDEPLNAHISDAHISNMLCHYGNIAQVVGKTLEVDSKTGKVTNSDKVKEVWSRDYEPGWEV